MFGGRERVHLILLFHIKFLLATRSPTYIYFFMSKFWMHHWTDYNVLQSPIQGLFMFDLLAHEGDSTTSPEKFSLVRQYKLLRYWSLHYVPSLTIRCIKLNLHPGLSNFRIKGIFCCEKSFISSQKIPLSIDSV